MEPAAGLKNSLAKMLIGFSEPGKQDGLGLKGRKSGYIDLGHIDKLLDETGEYLIIANLYNWGETLLHPAAAEIVKRFHERGIFTSISSNLNLRNFNTIKSVCDAGLDHIIISADGISESRYTEYRKGGN
jgi:MoaA/NifB/PqqE/SkfB family radical SAM enzyme